MNDAIVWALIGMLGAFAASMVAVVLFAMSTAFHRFDDRLDALEQRIDAHFSTIERRLDAIERRQLT